ncbi:unnamed protein product [Didymodactylos carnosus]|uniref:BHLH domain-containing protein n=1 Tax=Didymodactylos carnosus TaxID=1234261 RepID=A0A813SQN3_9BILA|nr:unnamed protein product [Didymodactylos carnosus]CAF1059010.1 unnamed protein product [Didymodactylos carnosus]CAF3585941.1 unnamed protein product [Didymodactylos carnosus]CAF3824796.1 unnamed protein product [Didymodactylos carnosus]
MDNSFSCDEILFSPLDNSTNSLFDEHRQQMSLYLSSTDTTKQTKLSSNYRKKRKLNTIQREEATVREKHRMLKLNRAYSQLRYVLPVENKFKLSRIETLRTACNYISMLADLLKQDDSLIN